MCWPDAGFLAIVERIANGGEGVDAAALIANAHADENRRTIGIASYGNQSGEGLRDEIVTDLMGERTGAAESRDRSHDEARIDGAQRRIVEALALEHAGSVVLHDHINFGGEAMAANRWSRAWRNRDRGFSCRDSAG